MRPLVLVCIAACIEPAHPTPTVALPKSPPPQPPDACVPVERLQRDALADPESCTPRSSRPRVTRCLRSGGGAWGLVLDHTQWDRGDFTCDALVEGAEAGVVTPHFRARALYIDASGHATMGPPFVWSTLTDVRAFDYDGDGVGELLVTATRSAEGFSNHVPSATFFGGIWQAHDGVVATYAPSATIDVRSFADVDGDGRPDVITTRGFRFEVFDGDDTSYLFEGPAWAAHATTGGAFSFDLVAYDFMNRTCAGETVRTADGLSLVRAAACAKASGESARKIERDYIARCTQLERARENWSVIHAACRADPLSDKPAMPEELRALLER